MPKSKRYDIVVGISTKNCEATISKVTKTIDVALTKFFRSKKSLIVCSDGFSTDKTKENFEKTNTRNDKFFTEEIGKIGKGSAVRTTFIKAKEVSGKAVCLIDGDLESIDISWIKFLLGPIFKKYDLVVPFYLRDKDDAVLTNHLIYPLVKALFGVRIRQPIGGEYGLSIKLIDKLLDHPLFPSEFGIDIFITLVAFCEKMKLIEAKLGVKEHQSTKAYSNPDEVLIPMFNQVMSEFFDLMDYYKEVIRHSTYVKRIESYGPELPKEAKEVPVDILSIIKDYREKYSKFNKRSIVFPKQLKEKLDSICEYKTFVFPADVWVKSVYYIIKGYRKNINQSFDILRILWKVWFANFAIQTAHMTDEQADRVIEEDSKVFIQYRNLFFGR